jgi:hypothetical protein
MLVFVQAISLFGKIPIPTQRRGQEMHTQLVEAAPMRKVKGFTGNRYTEAQKKKVTQYVQEYDTKHGRGGIAAAQRQFKVSYIALRNWLTAGFRSRARPAGFHQGPDPGSGEGIAPLAAPGLSRSVFPDPALPFAFCHKVHPRGAERFCEKDWYTIRRRR